MVPVDSTPACDPLRRHARGILCGSLHNWMYGHSRQHADRNSPIMQGRLLQRCPNLGGVFTYDDATAIGAAAAAKAVGKHILLASRNATPEGSEAVKDGTLDGDRICLCPCGGCRGRSRRRSSRRCATTCGRWSSRASSDRWSIDRRLPLAEAASAHRVMEAGQHFGKLVLVTDADRG